MPDVILNSDIEFIRNSLVLIPQKHEPAFEAVLVAPIKKKEKLRVFCSCTKGNYAECSHAQRITEAWNQLCPATQTAICNSTPDSSFLAEVLKPLVRFCPWVIDNCAVEQPTHETVRVIRNGCLLIEYRSPDIDAGMFASRMNMKHLKPLSRAELIRRAEKFVLDEDEKIFASHNVWTDRRAQENSVWSRFLYHLKREFDNSLLRYSAEVDENAGMFFLCIGRENVDNWLVKICVPSEMVPAVMDKLKKHNAHGPEISGLEAEIRFAVSFENQNRSMVFSPFTEEPDKNGDMVRTEIRKQRVFGSFVYMPQAHQFARLSPASLGILANHWDSPRTVTAEEAPAFIEKNISQFSFLPADSQTATLDLFSSGGDDLKRIDGISIVRSFEGVELDIMSAGPQSCEVAAVYVSGKSRAALRDMLVSRSRGERFLIINNGIVDLKYVPLTRLYRTAQKAGGNKGLKLERQALLQLKAAGSVTLKIDESKQWAEEIRNMLELRPVKPLEMIYGLKSELRLYQKNGVSWLMFLWDNGFGGLLCDDMGLGKTHQIMGFMAALREQREVKGPFLVVCPATVLPHWQRLISTFMPNAAITVIQGTIRDWGCVDNADIVLMTYSVLRSDTVHASAKKFSMAVFDEAHYIKNPSAQVSAAARNINAVVKVCLTGTPIENSASDLKSLFDTVMPGYLGEDDDFIADFVDPIEEKGDAAARNNLRRITSPFITRRLKSSVLTDLPPKIEDVRYCELAAEQAEIYADLMANKGGPLLAELRNESKPVPYMHIFSLLNVFKQLCDHPSVVAKKPSGFETHQSGKWDLFVELMEEILGSDQKVVVYSQYLHMIEIIRLYLKNLKISCAVLTGSSSDRGEIVRRFNEDQDCRVFIGSLKAGGLGIDLTSASVVIHYDRWWNAAREDQATDRVHRIGQTRGVQVLKLVTLNTVEEKIDALIASRRELSETLLAEDAPDEIKSFTRQELISLLEQRK
jgi:superfamily II DNA or RNA helicase